MFFWDGTDDIDIDIDIETETLPGRMGTTQFPTNSGGLELSQSP